MRYPNQDGGANRKTIRRCQGSNYSAIFPGGNVGIGTTTPSEALHVVGNGLFTGNLTVNGTINATLSGDGSGLTNLNASNISSVTLGNARVAATHNCASTPTAKYQTAHRACATKKMLHALPAD